MGHLIIFINLEVLSKMSNQKNLIIKFKKHKTFQVNLFTEDVVIALSYADNLNQNVYTLGAPFLRQFCTTYNIDENSVQLSQSYFAN